MKRIDRLRSVVANAAIAVSALALPACSLEELEPAQRAALTGVSDLRVITLTVTAPLEVTLEDEPHVFEYRVGVPDVRDFANVDSPGQLSLALSGLTPDIELVKDLDHKTVGITESTMFTGTFAVRSLATRDDPVELRLALSSVSNRGERVDHPPVALRLSLRAPALGLACRRTPSSGLAPLRVAFEADTRGCTGECRFRWDFGDESGGPERNVEHTYARAGVYTAVGILEDGPERIATCQREVEVLEIRREPAPVPTPLPVPPTAPPVASFISTIVAQVPRLDLDASASTGDIVSYTWELSWTPDSPDAVRSSPLVSFPAPEFVYGTITLTVTAADGRTATASRVLP